MSRRVSTEVVTLSANTSWYLFNFRAATIRRLLSEGYRVVCLSPEDSYSARLSELGCEWWPVHMDNAGSNPLKDAWLVLQFWRHYRRLRPAAALHFTIKNNVYGTWAARVAGVPAINNVSGLGTAFTRKGFVAAVARQLYRLSLPLAARVFCQNVDDRQLLVSRRIVSPSQLALLPGSGVDLVRFSPLLRQPHPGPFRFLYAGRLLADKGLYELIAAFRALRKAGHEAELWLCGFAGVSNVSAITEADLEAWGREPFVTWLGPTDAIESVMAQIDCIVLPSYYGEGVPRSLLEAAAMGLPAITTDAPGCRHVVEDGFNGLLCKARDPDSLQASMTQVLLMTAEELERMGSNGRARVEERFSEEVVVDATLAAVRECNENPR